MKIRPFKLPLIAAVIVLTLNGCEPEFKLTGTITDFDGYAIPNADVQVDCGGRAFERARTDQNGKFVSYGIGWCAGDCSVAVHAEGFVPYYAPVLKHCAEKPWHHRNACLTVLFDVRLARQ
jgi:hypothetical protein